jgi:hypothetical protein
LRKSVERREYKAASAERAARTFVFSSSDRQQRVEALLQKLDDIRHSRRV